MKKILIVLSIAFSSFKSFSQSDTTRVEQYCEVIATPRFLSNKVTLEVNFGEEKGFWKDNRLKSDEGKFKKI
jgi:hypothetical protein